MATRYVIVDQSQNEGRKYLRPAQGPAPAWTDKLAEAGVYDTWPDVEADLEKLRKLDPALELRHQYVVFCDPDVSVAGFKLSTVDEVHFNRGPKQVSVIAHCGDDRGRRIPFVASFRCGGVIVGGLPYDPDHGSYHTIQSLANALRIYLELSDAEVGQVERRLSTLYGTLMDRLPRIVTDPEPSDEKIAQWASQWLNRWLSTIGERAFHNPADLIAYMYFTIASHDKVVSRALADPRWNEIVQRFQERYNTSCSPQELSGLNSRQIHDLVASKPLRIADCFAISRLDLPASRRQYLKQFSDSMTPPFYEWTYKRSESKWFRTLESAEAAREALTKHTANHTTTVWAEPHLPKETE